MNQSAASELSDIKQPSSCTKRYWIRVALDVPLPRLFDYYAITAVQVGVRVIVPFGRRTLIGMVAETVESPHVEVEAVKPIDKVLDDLPPMPEDWLRLCRFAAQYYQRPL